MSAKTVTVTLVEALEAARQHHVSGNLLLAGRAYQEVLDNLPDNYDATHQLGIVLYQQGNLEEAIKYVRRASEIFQEDPICFNNLAIMLTDSGEYEEAITQWEGAIELDPNYAVAYSNMANALTILERLEEAEIACNKAIDIDDQCVDAYLNLGNVLQETDRLKEAVTAWEKAVEINPQYAKAYSNLANAYREHGRLADSETASLKAIEYAPNLPEAYVNLGVTYRAQHRIEEAEEVLRKAIKIKKDDPIAWNNLALVLMDIGRLEEALEAAQYSVTFDDKFGKAWSNMGIIYRELAQVEEAEKAARKAVTLQPDSVEALVDLANLLFQMDRFTEAEQALNKAIEADPEMATVQLKLATTLERMNRADEALEIIEAVKEANPELPAAFQGMARVLLMLGRGDEALEAARRALELSPDLLSAISAMAEAHFSRGELEEAKEYLKKIMDANDKLTFVYSTYSQIKKFEPGDPDIEKMKEILSGLKGGSIQSAMTMNFALAKAHDDIGEYEQAFEYYSQANTIKKHYIRYDYEGSKRLYDATAKLYDKAFFEQTADFPACDADTPIFIVGMPRSGTTLTEQIISSHGDVHGAGELTDFAHLDGMIGVSLEDAETNRDKYAELGEAYLARIMEYSDGAKRVTDKLPGNFCRLGAIIKAFPNAKIIHCMRNPADTALSCFKQNFSRGQMWSYDLEDTAREYKLYLDMMEHWRNVLPAGAMLEINYEDTVGDTEAQARKMLEFLGLEWDPAVLEPHKQKRSVMTASRAQVRRPVYKTSVKGWKRYEDQMMPFVNLLEELEKA